MIVSIETSEGRMEINFRTMELYKQMGDLCCSMVSLDNGGQWIATCPMSGREYLISMGEIDWTIAYPNGEILGTLKRGPK